MGFEDAAVQENVVVELPSRLRSDQFPADALGGVLGPACNAISEIVQVPKVVAAQSLLASASMAVQHHANLTIDGRIYPLSLFLLTELGSGDRKSSSDSLAIQFINDEQSNRVAEYRDDHRVYEDLMDIYKSERGRILKGKDLDKERELAKLREPAPPLTPEIMAQEPTLEALHKQFATGYPAQCLFHDEGGQFFGGHAMSAENGLKTMAGLSKYWDGAQITRNRACDDFVIIPTPRLALHLMIQPTVAEQVFADPMLHGQGLLARFLIAAPESIAGTRQYQERDATDSRPIIECQKTLAALLMARGELNAGSIRFQVLTVSPGAKAAWIDFYNEVESKLAPHGELVAIKAAASKFAENLARIAGVLAKVDNADVVSDEHMDNAVVLAGFYLNEYLRVMVNSAQNKKLVEARDLLTWLQGRADENGRSLDLHRIDDIQRLGPNKHRLGVRHIRSLMAALVEHGHFQVVGSDQNNRPSSWGSLS